MTFSKIQVIKMLREQNPSLGLKEAKRIVDLHELKNFENRVVNALGSEARNELYQWATVFVATRNTETNKEYAWTEDFNPSWKDDVDPLWEIDADGNSASDEDCDCSGCRQWKENNKSIRTQGT